MAKKILIDMDLIYGILSDETKFNGNLDNVFEHFMEAIYSLNDSISRDDKFCFVMALNKDKFERALMVKIRNFIMANLDNIDENFEDKISKFKEQISTQEDDTKKRFLGFIGGVIKEKSLFSLADADRETYKKTLPLMRYFDAEPPMILNYCIAKKEKCDVILTNNPEFVEFDIPIIKVNLVNLAGS